MYSLLVCAAAAFLVYLLGIALSLWGWLAGTLVAIPVFVVAWLFLNRYLARRLQPKLELMQRQAEAGQVDAARQTLTELLPEGRWVPMLRGQLEGQLGILALSAGDKKRAIEHLERSSRRSAEGQLMLATLHYRDKAPEKAFAVLERALPFHRKNSLLRNVYAYLLNNQGRVDDAIAQLNQLLAKSPDDPIAKDNLLRLQNRKRMDLRGFGTEWYALGLERPPASMGQMQTARKGFRQPPKRRKS